MSKEYENDENKSIEICMNQIGTANDNCRNYNNGEERKNAMRINYYRIKPVSKKYERNSGEVTFNNNDMDEDNFGTHVRISPKILSHKSTVGTDADLRKLRETYNDSQSYIEKFYERNNDIDKIIFNMYNEITDEVDNIISNMYDEILTVIDNEMINIKKAIIAESDVEASGEKDLCHCQQYKENHKESSEKELEEAYMKIEENVIDDYMKFMMDSLGIKNENGLIELCKMIVMKKFPEDL